MAFYEPQSKSKLFFRKRDIISQLNHFSHSRHISVLSVQNYCPFLPFQNKYLFFTWSIWCIFFVGLFSFFLFMLLLLLLMFQGHCESSFELNQRFHATNSQFIHASILCSNHWKPKETTTKKKKKIEANAHLLRIF